MPAASMSARWAAARPTPSASSGCWPWALTADQIARIHSPIGLDIGAASPAEIAVAVLAQVDPRAVDARRRPAQEGRGGVKFGPVADRRGRRRDPRARRPMPATSGSARRTCCRPTTVAELKAAGIARSRRGGARPGRSRRGRGRRRASPQGMRDRRHRDQAGGDRPRQPPCPGCRRLHGRRGA